MNVKLSDFPEKINEDGVKEYGTTSYETQIAILSHFLHSLDGNQKMDAKINRNEILTAIRDYIEYKQLYDKLNPFWQDVDEEQMVVAAENPFESDLFRDFYEIPFPAPENPKFTFIDLFAGIGGFRIAMQGLGGKCVYSSEFDAQAQKTYMANYGEMPFGDIT